MLRSLRIHTLLLICLTMVSASAQVSFKVKVSKKEIGKNENLKVEFKVNAKGSNFKGPDFRNFQVLEGPHPNFSTFMDNYGVRYDVTYLYYVRPRKTGNLTIGPASITVEGNTYKTKPVTVKVSATSPRSSDPNDPQNVAARNAFVKAATSKTEVYQGEPLVGFYKVYFKTDIGNPNLLEEPDFTGFYKEDIEIKRIQTQTETYKGERYTTGVIRRVLLVPQRSGNIDLGSVEVQIPTQIPTRRRDFFGRPVTKTVNQISTAPFPRIVVKPLPEEGRPSDFDGAVGHFDLDVSISRDEVNANESLTLRVKLSGKGNIKLLEVPKPEIPSAFEAYDPKYSENISIGAAGMRGSKTYEYLLIPRYGGTYKIPAFKYSYFDTKAKKYKTLSSPEFEVTVVGGKEQPGGSGGIVSAQKEGVDFINKDILFIKTQAGKLRKMDTPFFGSVLFYSLLGGSSALWLGLIGFFMASSGNKESFAQRRSQKAGKVARKHLSLAVKELNSGNKDSFYTELSTALWGYFSDKLGISQSQVSKENIEALLKEKNIDPALISELREIMDRAEMARFTSVGGSAPQKDYDETVRIITSIEKQLG